MAVQHFALVLALGLTAQSALAQSALSFETATASSSHAAGTFSASEALRKGSGYWCSAGKHPLGQTVTWAGTLGSSQRVFGVSISWAYSPGEYKILTSADGGNFEEATAWKAATRADAAFKETVVFETPRAVKVLTVAMRSPGASGYFGINDITVLSEPGHIMLVSGGAAGSEEQCLVATAKGVVAQSCLDAIAAGTGAEIFELNEASQLVSVAQQACVSVADRGALGGGRLLLQDCKDASDDTDGRSIFALSAQGRLAALGNFCVAASASEVTVHDCDAADGQGFVAVAVPEFDATTANAARDAAAVLRAAAARQSAALSQLQTLIPLLRDCKLGLAGNMSSTALALRPLLAEAPRIESIGDPALEVLARLNSLLGVDTQAIASVLAESLTLLAAAVPKAT